MASAMAVETKRVHTTDDSHDYIEFNCLPPGGKLNRWSQNLTNGHDFPGAQAMLYGAGVPDEDMMKNAPHVGVSTVWWEGNPCKYAVLTPISHETNLGLLTSSCSMHCEHAPFSICSNFSPDMFGEMASIPNWRKQYWI